jgi:predicted DNA-binding transcriptional regulator YafY
MKSKEKETDRLARLYYVEHLLFQKSYGWTLDEIADKCEVNARTTRRDIKALEDAGVPVYQNGDKWCVNQEYYLPPVRFSRSEAMGIFLASRLMLHYANRSDSYMKSTFYKLNCVVPSPLKEQILNTVEWMEKLPKNDSLGQHIEALALAWTAQCTVRMSYHTYGESKPRYREVDPYFIQPTDSSHASYLIAYCHLNKAVRVFKIARIRSLDITNKKYKIPDTFDADRYLEPAWGVIADGKVGTIKLKFSSSVAQMFQEAIYHPSQIVTSGKDGSALVTLKVVPGVELVGWIMGWGENVEVLEPKELKDQVKATIKAMAKLYK